MLLGYAPVFNARRLAPIDFREHGDIARSVDIVGHAQHVVSDEASVLSFLQRVDKGGGGVDSRAQNDYIRGEFFAGFQDDVADGSLPFEARDFGVQVKDDAVSFVPILQDAADLRPKRFFEGNAFANDDSDGQFAMSEAGGDFHADKTAADDDSADTGLPGLQDFFCVGFGTEGEDVAEIRTRHL